MTTSAGAEGPDPQDLNEDTAYFGREITEELIQRRTSRLAVVVHVYYLDGWHHIAAMLHRLSPVRTDLVVTVPQNRAHLVPVVQRDRPDALTLVVPNHGKDCYPFIRVARRLRDAGYVKVLKLQTKKLSGDAHDAQWQVSALDQLIPASHELLLETVAALDLADVAIIGPRRYYLPIDIALNNVRKPLTTQLQRLYDGATAEFLLGDPLAHGFFSGTMFWARLEALAFTDGIAYGDFPQETGQKDGTLSHALERLFTLVPQAEQRTLLELTTAGLEFRPYRFDGELLVFEG